VAQEITPSKIRRKIKMPGFEPQTDIHIGVVPIDAAMETTPTITEAALLAVPDGANFQLELLSVGFRANTLPVDAGDPVTFDLEWIDDSAADVVANLLAAYNMLAAGSTVLVYNTVWRGSQVLDPGDVVNAEFTVSTPTTASEGAALIVEYKVLRHS
jgi:hypothetical protein